MPNTESKGPRGRPVEREMPEPIQDTPESIVQSVLRTRPQSEIDRINSLPR